MIKIMNHSKRLISNLVMKNTQKEIDTLPLSIKQYLDTIDVEIIICNMIENCGIDARGCYYDVLENNWNVATILLSDKYIFNKHTLYHEIGHVLDSYLGCKKSNKETSAQNLKINKLSLTEPKFREYAIRECDLLSIYTDDELQTSIINDDLSEVFADAFADVALGKRFLKLAKTKTIVLQTTKELLIN